MKTKNDKYIEHNDIVEVKEVNLATDANAHIKLGWRLLATYKTTSPNQNQSIKYCLGKPEKSSKLTKSLDKTTTIDQKADKNFVYSL